MRKERLDVLLVERGLIASRERAKASIMAGLVFVDGQKVDKAGTMVLAEADIVLHGDTIGYVSRGGLKLEKAIAQFAIDLSDKVVIDIGASTGGFTDCALKNGARRVYAVDVGYGQLAWSLRTDPRVVNMERTNIRYVNPEDIGELADFISIDVAFISLAKVLPTVKKLLKQTGYVVALIKPQFEAGREKVGKKGVVKDPKVHAEVIENVIHVLQQLNFSLLGLSYSPIKGPEGNIEYLAYFTSGVAEADLSGNSVEQVVNEAQANLG